LRHQVALESIITAYAGGSVMGIEALTNTQEISTRRLPLAANLPASDPRAMLKWFPRPGDFYNVDAANPPNAGASWLYRNGPVMRMVIELRQGRVRGQNVIPAGESGQNASPNFDDQARLWLGNRALPLRYTVDEVVANATGRERFSAR
jgi:acyl-homoserine lactone acylase PvdQ